MRKCRIWIAALASFLVGMPLAEEASAGWGYGAADITWSAISLAAAITGAAASS